jgi:hypothetical protein
MRKVIACEFLTLDGVIQSDPEGDFKYSGWFFGYADDVTGAVIQKRLSEPVDLLLGRRTFGKLSAAAHDFLKQSCAVAESLLSF